VLHKETLGLKLLDALLSLRNLLLLLDIDEINNWMVLYTILHLNCPRQVTNTSIIHWHI